MLPSSREGLAAFDQILYDSCALVRPAEKLDVAEWADKYGYLSPEGAAQPGKWYTSNAEYQREPMRCLSNRCYQTVVLMWSSQVGKTQIGLFGCAYYAAHDPCPQLAIQPSEDMAKVLATDRIEPMIRDTPELRDIFGSGRNDTLHKTFPGGHWTAAWASSPAQLAMRPIRFVWTDEEGRYGPNREGDAVDQARKRQATYKGNRIHLRTSSPALRRTCRITKAFEDSDQRHYFVPCPHCGHFQTFRWEQLKWPTGKPEECYYVCEAAGCEILESDKYSMVRKGEWRALNPGGGDKKTAGFHLNALYSTIGYDWSEIINEYLKCVGIPDKMQVFTNTVLALPWDEEAEGVDLNAIQKHAEEYPAQAPSWSVIYTCGADVQPDRIEATKLGWGLDSVSGVIEHRVFHGATNNAKGGAWLEFDAWRKTRVEHESGLMLPIACTFVDSGDGNRTQTVYEYCRSREREKVFACKGSSISGAPLVSEARRVGRYRTLLVMVGTSTAKDIIYSRLKIEDRDEPGYIHFPNALEAGCGAEYFSNLTAEALVVKFENGRNRSQWVKQRRRNEALDCFVYGYAAKEFIKANMKALANGLQARIEREKPSPPALRRKILDTFYGISPKHGLPLTSVTLGDIVNPQKRPVKMHKKPRKVIRRPGHAWIGG